MAERKTGVLKGAQMFEANLADAPNGNRKKGPGEGKTGSPGKLRNPGGGTLDGAEDAKPSNPGHLVKAEKGDEQEAKGPDGRGDEAKKPGLKRHVDPNEPIEDAPPVSLVPCEEEQAPPVEDVPPAVHVVLPVLADERSNLETRNEEEKARLRLLALHEVNWHEQFDSDDSLEASRTWGRATASSNPAVSTNNHTEEHGSPRLLKLQAQVSELTHLRQTLEQIQIGNRPLPSPLPSSTAQGTAEEHLRGEDRYSVAEAQGAADMHGRGDAGAVLQARHDAQLPLAPPQLPPFVQDPLAGPRLPIPVPLPSASLQSRCIAPGTVCDSGAIWSTRERPAPATEDRVLLSTLSGTQRLLSRDVLGDDPFATGGVEGETEYLRALKSKFAKQMRKEVQNQMKKNLKFTLRCFKGAGTAAPRSEPSEADSWECEEEALQPQLATEIRPGSRTPWAGHYVDRWGEGEPCGQNPPKKHARKHTKRKRQHSGGLAVSASNSRVPFQPVTPGLPLSMPLPFGSPRLSKNSYGNAPFAMTPIYPPLHEQVYRPPVSHPGRLPEATKGASPQNVYSRYVDYIVTEATRRASSGSLTRPPPSSKRSTSRGQ
ncbi:hypothetical protein DIPPA_10372 [Diplonema papillatum]|nr:hypothetical protein DIPPA_10372 [Diplonema papillatum]